MNKNFSRSFKASELMTKYWSLSTDFNDPLHLFYRSVYLHWTDVYQRSIKDVGV